MSLNSSYIVYGLLDPNTKELFYIGKSICGVKRISEHNRDSSLKNDGNTPKANKIRKMKRNGQIPEVTILYNLGNCQFDKKTINEILYKKEQELINFYNILGYKLTNRQDGGPGSPGRILSEESRKKMSERAKKQPLPQGLINNQKPKFQDPEGKRICSGCLKIKELIDFRFDKKGNILERTCKVCRNINRPSRIIPGAWEKAIESRGKKVQAKNIETNEVINFKGLRPASRIIGGKCSKTGISLAIKNNSPYYGFIWSFI